MSVAKKKAPSNVHPLKPAKKRPRRRGGYETAARESRTEAWRAAASESAEAREERIDGMVREAGAASLLRSHAARDVLLASLRASLLTSEAVKDLAAAGKATSDDLKAQASASRNILAVMQRLGTTATRDHDDCPECDGDGKIKGEICGECDGTGERDRG